MDLPNVLAELRRERDALDVAIFNLERLENAGNPGSGRASNGVSQSITNGASRGYSAPTPSDGEE
jgi:hypothetical protein